MRDDVVEDVPMHLAKAIPIFLQFHGVVEWMSSSMVLFGYGLPRDSGDAVVDQRTLVAAALLEKLGSNVKVVHGRAEGLYGNVGTHQLANFGSIFPKLGGILETLARSNFGQASEISG